MTTKYQKLVRGWGELAPKFLPFADAASEDLPLSRLLRLSLFQVSVGMALVLLVGFIALLTRVKSFRFPGDQYLLKDFDVGTLGQSSPKVVTADATESVDSNLNCQLRLQYSVMPRPGRLKGYYERSELEEQ